MWEENVPRTLQNFKYFLRICKHAYRRFGKKLYKCWVFVCVMTLLVYTCKSSLKLVILVIFVSCILVSVAIKIWLLSHSLLEGRHVLHLKKVYFPGNVTYKSIET